MYLGPVGEDQDEFARAVSGWKCLISPHSDGPAGSQYVTDCHTKERWKKILYSRCLYKKMKNEKMAEDAPALSLVVFQLNWWNYQNLYETLNWHENW